MNNKIGFIGASILFLIAVLSAPLVFAQPWTSSEVNAQVENLVVDVENGFFSFTVIPPNPGTPNLVSASNSGTGASYQRDVFVGDVVVVSNTNLVADDVTFNEGTGHLLYQGPADSITINAVEIPEFPSFLILPLFMITTLLAAIVLRKKLIS